LRAPDRDAVAAADHDARPRPRPVVGRELRLRAASALLLAAVALSATYLGGAAFLALWVIAAIAMLWEWERLVTGSAHLRFLTMSMAGLFGGAVLLGMGRPGAATVLLAATAGASGLLAPARKGWMLLGGGCAAALLAGPAVLRDDSRLGLCAMLLLFAVVWTTDVMAFFCGRLAKGPKLWPAISPNKTWSGAIGGLVGAVVVGSALAHALGLDGVPALAAVCAALSGIAQAGDLLESAFKRHFGAKDTSALIPGHGGIMDRLDGFLCAVSAATLLGLARAGIDAPARGLLLW
jgi:phosphatidate cytidylyltransferase